MRIDFGPWEPDKDDQGDAGLTVARNVIPSEGRYRPLGQFQRATAGNASEAGILAAGVGFAPGGDTALFAASPTTIYRAPDRTFTAAQTGYTSTSWEFAQWGTEMLAVSPEEGLVAGNIASGGFSVVADAPAARYIARFGDFVMLGAVVGSENRIQWSGFNNRSQWGANALNQSDAQDLPNEFGAVTALVSGEYPTVFQERAISRITHVGPPTVFSIDTFPIKKGCVAPKSVVQVGPVVFFIGQDGPNIWTGQSAQPIGNGEFSRWWRDSVTSTEAASAKGALDWKNKCVIWQWSGGGIVYSWTDDRAAEFAPGISFSALVDAPLSEETGDALVHPAWSDGLYSAAAIDTDGYFGTFCGSPYEATFETPEIAANADRHSFVSEIWPDTDAGAAFVTIGSRQQRASDALVWGDEVEMQSNGMAPFNVDARFHRGRLRIPAGTDWTHTKGLDVNAAATGRI